MSLATRNERKASAAQPSHGSEPSLRIQINVADRRYDWPATTYATSGVGMLEVASMSAALNMRFER